MRELLQTEKRNISLEGRRTSLQLEGYIWQNLAKVAKATGLSEEDMLNDIYRRKIDIAMAPAVRLFLNCYMLSHLMQLQEKPKFRSSFSKILNLAEAEEPEPQNATKTAMDSYQRALSVLDSMA